MQQKGAEIFYGLAKCLQFVQNHCTVEERGQCIDLVNQQKKRIKQQPHQKIMRWKKRLFIPSFHLQSIQKQSVQDQKVLLQHH